MKTKNLSKAFVILCWVLCLTPFATAQEVNPDKILGTYLLESIQTDDKGKVLVTKADDGTYQGRLIWISNPTNPDGSIRCDEKNADKKLRSRRYDEIIMFHSLTFKKGEWVNGKLYDPFSGKMVSIKFKLDKNGSDLVARYYKGVPTLGITRTWKRVK